MTAKKKMKKKKKKKGKPTPKKKSLPVIRAWLEGQDAYTVTFVMDVWEFDLLDVQAYAKYNDNHRYILSVIERASVFRTIFDGPKYSKRRPVRIGTDKGN